VVRKLKTVSARYEADYSVTNTAYKDTEVSTHVTKKGPEIMPSVSGTLAVELNLDML
jgi:hypothetical protein